MSKIKYYNTESGLWEVIDTQAKSVITDEECKTLLELLNTTIKNNEE